MWTWLVTLGLVVAFFAWMGWVLHKRNPPRPGEQEYRQDHNFYGGPPGSGSAG